MKEQVRGCWFYGVIHAIFSSRNWAYFGCSDAKCCKKLREEDVVCSKCGRSKDEGVWRYTLKMKVRHGTTFADVMFWDEEARLLLGKAAGDFYEHLNVATLRPISCPEVISELIGREYLFKIKSANTNSNYGEQVYVIGMISSDKEKIKQFKMAAGSEGTSSEAYNSDEDLELLFESVPTGDSNVVISDTETDEKGTPKSIGRGRESDEAVTGDVNGETQGSSNKKLKAVKIEKP
ncbi:unnamed protein product [Cuscuta epithymum]|uniref:Replication factor A C-terminal domain-containing protein n=1 Tax=Cuscuta epithymum TaxID=186058 RepID=A0AAV0GEJ8_9ASTE|nr:unnamed protein product [Cuscuta epithymum]